MVSGVETVAAVHSVAGAACRSQSLEVRRSRILPPPRICRRHPSCRLDYVDNAHRSQPASPWAAAPPGTMSRGHWVPLLGDRN